MVSTCALNDINANMKLIGIFILIILLSIVVVYFMYCSHNKHSEILENFTGGEAALTNHNYGSEHKGPYADGDKKTITGDVTLRDCQVYFVGEDQQGDCDEEYKANPNTTCKYVFKDDWKEIANIKVGEEKTNVYPNKIYNQSYTKTDINNHDLTAQCVKKFESDIDKRYIYRDNELIGYNHDGSNDGNTLELNYKLIEDDESDEYVKGDFISMTFGKNDTPQLNYSNVINSICSKRYNDQPNLKVGDIFYKFKLNDSNQIISVEYAKVKSDKKSFKLVEINLNEFADSKSTNFSYNEDTNSINVIKGAEVNPENVTIYKFEYDYLCGDNYAGIIKGFTTSDFTMNKKYVDSIGMTPITKTIGPKGSDKIIIPEKLKKIFKVENLNTDSIISSLRKEGEELIKITNVDPKIEKDKLSRLIDAYIKKIKEAEDNSETFGVNKSADYIFNYNFEKIIEGNFIEIVGNDKENITSIADKEKVPYTFGFTKGHEKYIADVKFSNKFIESSVTPAPVFANETEHLQYRAEQLSGVKGWRLVKFLPPHLNRWFTPTPFDSTSQSNVYIGTAYDYTNEFMVPFDKYDEMFFSSLDLKYWLHTTSNAVWGKFYGNEPRQVLKSSANPNNHYVRWYNRYNVVEDPWISVKDHHSRQNLVLYGEDRRHIGNHHSYVRNNHGGLCVFVRDSSANIETFTAKTDNIVYTFKHDGGNSHHTAHKIKFNGLVNCEILVIGGGGGGGSRFGGGGGAGLLFYKKDYKIENGELKIYVGKGGIGINRARSGNGSNGHDSYIIHSVSGELIRAKGGGGGSCDWGCGNGRDGGSGGGASYNNNTRGGRTSQHESQFAFGNVGGNGNWKNHARHGRVTGGGGGADGPGKGNEVKTSPDGGPGKMINITGIPTYYAAGGGGASSNWDYAGHDAIGKGGKGGGGNGGEDNNLPDEFYEDRVHNNTCWRNRGNLDYCGTQGLCCRNSHHGCVDGSKLPNGGPRYTYKHYCVRAEGAGRPKRYKKKSEAQNGKNHTGSGGGGAALNAKGGDGGSGIVIIKITKITDEGKVIPTRNWVEAITHFDSRSAMVDKKLYHESFTIGITSLEKQEKKACKIGGYIFLESNTYFDTNFILNYEGFVYNYSLLTIEKINSGGSKTVVKNIKPDDSDKTFSISTSGFYIYEITVVMFNQNIILTDIDFSLHCKKGSSRIPINLKDYLYKGRVYPIDYDTFAPHVSTELKIEKFNRYIRKIRMTNNTVDSLREFKEIVLNNYLKDYFNIFFWKSCNIMAKAKNNAIFILEEGCNPHEGDSIYRENCTLLNNIKKLKSQILRYTSITEINKLFEDTEFKAPGFNTNININDEFTSDSHNINNFITNEKEDNYLKRTQRKTNDNFFKFTENAEKSIYVKRLPGKDLIFPPSTDSPRSQRALPPLSRD